MPAKSSPHLVIPYAACGAESWLPAMRTMPTDGMKRLGQVLAGMALIHTDSGVAESLSPPHERALAMALGIAGEETPDGLIPWAANDAAMNPQANGGRGWAWITPCHWAMGHLHATLSDPAALALGEDESLELLALMRPYFETDGIALHYLAPARWLAEGDVFRNLPTASLDRVLARNVDAWLPGSSAAAPLRRLQNEMQMLLYTHAFNDAREAKRQLPVNSFWMSGSGEALSCRPQPGPKPVIFALSRCAQAHLEPQRSAPALSQGEREKVCVPRTLANAVFKEDWTAYQQAWQALDAGEIADLLLRQRAGETVRLTLCGERNALTYETRAASLKTRITRLFSPLRTLDVLEQL